MPGFRDKLIKYKLIKPDWAISQLAVGDLPNEFKDTVKLMRAKCYASAAIHRSTRSYLEKRDLVENYLLDSQLTIEQIGAIYSKHHNVNSADGVKLAQFKVDELQSLRRHIHTILIETNLKIEVAKTVSEVVDLYNLTQVSLGMHNAFDITTML
jgi:hypothetical protein